MNCPLCSSLLIRKMDSIYYKCDTCFALVKDKQHYLSASEEKARYETHNNDVNDARYQKFTSPITNFVLENYSKEHKGLDFGSGTGPVISKMLQDKNYNISQYDPFFAPDTEPLTSTYDYVVGCEVFEHFHNPRKELEKLSNLLNKNGRLLIMTFFYNNQIDFTNWVYRNDPTHVFIYRKETIEYIAAEMKFEIECLTDRFAVLKKRTVDS